jgi:hypothetical protein
MTTDSPGSDIVFDPTKNAWCHLPSGACSSALPGTDKPSLPTYATIADVLEKKNGSGIRLAGWTVARTVLIAPWFRLVGVPWRKAFLGAAIASVAISVFTMLRIASAEYELNRNYLDQRRWLKQRRADGTTRTTRM